MAHPDRPAGKPIAIPCPEQRPQGLYGQPNNHQPHRLQADATPDKAAKPKEHQDFMTQATIKVCKRRPASRLCKKL